MHAQLEGLPIVTLPAFANYDVEVILVGLNPKVGVTVTAICAAISTHPVCASAADDSADRRALGHGDRTGHQRRYGGGTA